MVWSGMHDRLRDFIDGKQRLMCQLNLSVAVWFTSGTSLILCFCFKECACKVALFINSMLDLHIIITIITNNSYGYNYIIQYFNV